MFTSKSKSKARDIAPWEQFCRDEARRAAHEFLEKVRRLQTVDRSTMEVSENVFAAKFSAHFMEEVMDLTGGGPNGFNHSGEFTRNKKTGASKSWWNIFRRRQSSRGDDRAALAVAAHKNASNCQDSNDATTANVILEAHVKMLDMKKSSLALSWQPCRLVLSSDQGNHQLEIYCPPKVSREKCV